LSVPASPLIAASISSLSNGVGISSITLSQSGWTPILAAPAVAKTG
jgi:hypothetical protein